MRGKSHEMEMDLWTCRDYTRWIEERRVWIQGMGKHVMFREPIVVFGSILCNILYCIVESFSLIRGRRHGWSNHVKTSCIVCVIVLSLCS